MITSHRRRYDVILSPNAHWVFAAIFILGNNFSEFLFAAFFSLGNNFSEFLVASLGNETLLHIPHILESGLLLEKSKFLKLSLLGREIN